MKKFAWFVVIVVVLLIVLRARYEQTHPPGPPQRPDLSQPAPGVESTTTRPPPRAPTTTQAPKPVPVQEATTIVPGALELYPTYSAVGLELPFQGDADTNATAVMSWRRVGEPAWRNGVDVTIDRGRQRMWASIWPLEQDEAIEVRLELSDPAPLPEPRLAQTRTRKLVLTTAAGRTLFVSPTLGKDDNPGTREAPFKTLSKAAEGVHAGDTIYAMSGVYPEFVHLEYKKGVEGKPVVITAAPGHKPVLDGSRVIRPGAGWSQVEPGIYAISTEMAPESEGYVAQDGKRMYKYPTLDALRADEFSNKRVWAYDAEKKKLYVRTGDANAASAHTYNVALHAFGFWLEGSRYVVISGFEVRYYGNACIRISGPNAVGNVIYGNHVHNTQQGIFIKTETTDNNAVWNNLVAEPGIQDFSWNSIKYSPYARQGIIVFGAGRGNSFCHNKVHDWFDCINVESWLHPDELGMHRDTDVMFNDMWNVGDDGLEMDGGGINMRVHGNRIRNAHSAISLAPVERGPVYVTRNDCTYHNLFLKMSVGSDSVGWTYIWNNAGYTMLGSIEATMVRFNAEELVDRNRVLKNNAFIGSEFAVHRGRPNHELDYNCYYHINDLAPRKFTWMGQICMTIEEFRAVSGQEKHGMYVDPMFAATPDLAKYGDGLYPNYPDSKLGDLRPAPGSPLIDRGVVIRGFNEEFTGAAPDIGAFEVK